MDTAALRTKDMPRINLQCLCILLHPAQVNELVSLLTASTCEPDTLIINVVDY
jgi:hypothetical protein